MVTRGFEDPEKDITHSHPSPIVVATIGLNCYVFCTTSLVGERCDIALIIANHRAWGIREQLTIGVDMSAHQPIALCPTKAKWDGPFLFSEVPEPRSWLLLVVRLEPQPTEPPDWSLVRRLLLDWRLVRQLLLIGVLYVNCSVVPCSLFPFPRFNIGMEWI